MLRLVPAALVAALALACPSLARPVDRAVAARPVGHPSEYFVEAGKLFREGRRDDAVFLFYFGQMRYRTFLAARPDLPKDRDAAVFSSLMESIGRPINEYAFGDIPRLAAIIDEALDADARAPDPLTPPNLYPRAHTQVRAGLRALRAEILKRRDEIRQTRARNGLGNRN